MVSATPPHLSSLLAGILEELTPEKRLPSALPPLLGTVRPGRIVALGKAARAMARGAALLWPSVPGLLYEVEGPGKIPPGWTALSGSHPLPSPENLDATGRVVEWLAGGEGPLLALVSGGTSSLLVDPSPPWTLSEKSRVCADLMARGTPIADVNTVRMRLSRVKGGGLRRRIRNGPVCTGIWCDVAPEDFRIVGSAPTLSVPASPDAEEVLARVGLSIPRPLPPDRTLRRARAGDRHARLASGRDLERDTVLALRDFGYRARALRIAEGTDAGLFAARLRKLAREAPAGRWAWVTSGEASTLAGGGRGGRCSHLAALVALELAGLRGWTFAALATDGADGSGDGGAWVSSDALPPRSEICGCVAAGDTATLWATHGTSIPGKPTGNNLRDLYVLTVDR